MGLSNSSGPLFILLEYFFLKSARMNLKYDPLLWGLSFHKSWMPLSWWNKYAPKSKHVFKIQVGPNPRGLQRMLLPIKIRIRPKMVAEFTPSFLRLERLVFVSSFILFASFVMSMFWFPSPCIMTTCLLETNSWFKRNMEKMSVSAAIISRCVF